MSCPEQNRDYSKTFHLIDKGNGDEAKYDIGLQSHKHGWTPKLSLRYFNMNMNNAYKIYEYLVNKHTPGRCYYDSKEAIDEAAHALLQRGDSMRLHKAEHPVHVNNLATMWDTESGKRMRTDAQGAVADHVRAREDMAVCQVLRNLKKKQRLNPWCTHQSIAHKVREKCSFAGCTNLRNRNTKRRRSYNTFMKCEECSAESGKNVYFCNDSKSGVPVLCHQRHHVRNHCKLRSTIL